MLGVLRLWLLRILTPVSKLAGSIYIAPRMRQIQYPHVFRMREVLKKGDIILTKSIGELTNWLISGEYKHCAMYVGDDKIIEAVKDGVRIADLDYFCVSKDYVAICRPRFAQDSTIDKAVFYAVEHNNAAYDFNFCPSEEAFYCAELATAAYKFALNGKSPFTPRKIMGIETVLPVDFKLAKDKFVTILELPGVTT